VKQFMPLSAKEIYNILNQEMFISEFLEINLEEFGENRPTPKIQQMAGNFLLRQI